MESDKNISLSFDSTRRSINRMRKGELTNAQHDMTSLCPTSVREKERKKKAYVFMLDIFF
jgi:hypothetical protein